MIANKRKIEKLLFNRKDIDTKVISELTGIPYVSIAKYRTGERKYTGIHLDYAILLTEAYEKLKDI